MDSAAAVNDGHRLSGLKVLVIDDSKTIRRTAETLLAKEGCEVFTAVDGFDALSKIADHQPDIVFVDIMMPRLDGYQTCSLIKHNKYSGTRRSSCCRAKTAVRCARAAWWARSST
jgi:twitching motility two-component system response regulator PilG